MHWNILAQNLCRGFEKIDDHAPILRFSNRLRLIKQHLEEVDADIIGLVEIDALCGEFSNCARDLCTFMQGLGYAFSTYDKLDQKSGSAIFYKKHLFTMIKSEFRALSFDGSSQFLMHCQF